MTYSTWFSHTATTKPFGGVTLANNNNTKSVLIVDDEQMARTLLRLMLVRAGFQVREAIDGYDALDKIHQEPPDLIVLDVMMPGLDGFSVCQSVRNEPATADIPIIMLSAKGDIGFVNKGIQAGTTQYLTKPVSPENLTRHVRELLTERE
jgi:PleD family two-component response regulator